MPDQYTFIHPIDHQPYHTDRQTAEFLLDAKRRDMTAYEASFAHDRETGRIVEGVAPRQEQTPEVRQVLERTRPARAEASASPEI
jgi:hypothetical protein